MKKLKCLIIDMPSCIVLSFQYSGLKDVDQLTHRQTDGKTNRKEFLPSTADAGKEDSIYSIL